MLVNSLLVLNDFQINQWKTESKLNIVKSFISDDLLLSPKSHAQHYSTSRKSKYFENEMEDSDDILLSGIEIEHQIIGNIYLIHTSSYLLASI